MFSLRLSKSSSETKDLNTFTKETLQALTKSGGSDIVFNYQVKHKKDNAVELVWKKHVPAEDITVSYLEALYKYTCAFPYPLLKFSK
jgi:hypothetical protein